MLLLKPTAPVLVLLYHQKVRGGSGKEKDTIPSSPHQWIETH